MVRQTLQVADQLPGLFQQVSSGPLLLARGEGRLAYALASSVLVASLFPAVVYPVRCLFGKLLDGERAWRCTSRHSLASSSNGSVGFVSSQGAVPRAVDSRGVSRRSSARERGGWVAMISRLPGVPACSRLFVSMHRGASACAHAMNAPCSGLVLATCPPPRRFSVSLRPRYSSPTAETAFAPRPSCARGLKPRVEITRSRPLHTVLTSLALLSISEESLARRILP